MPEQGFDPAFEFNAPKFHDFTKADDGESSGDEEFFNKLVNQPSPGNADDGAGVEFQNTSFGASADAEVQGLTGSTANVEGNKENLEPTEEEAAAMDEEVPEHSTEHQSGAQVEEVASTAPIPADSDNTESCTVSNEPVQETTEVEVTQDHEPLERRRSARLVELEARREARESTGSVSSMASGRGGPMRTPRAATASSRARVAPYKAEERPGSTENKEWTGKLTIPASPKFRTSSRAARKLGMQAIAEAAENRARIAAAKTPKSSRAVSRTSTAQTPASAKTPRSSWKPRLTIPKSPKFNSTARSSRRGAVQSEGSCDSLASHRSKTPLSSRVGSKRPAPEPYVAPKLTAPESPRFASRSTRQRMGVSETTDEMALRKAKEEVDALVKQRRMARHRANQPTAAAAVRSAKPLTMPEEPRLRTAAAAGARKASTHQDGNSDVEGDGPYVPLAEKLLKMNKTPQRFRTKPSREANSRSTTPSERARSVTPTRLTIPKEPRFTEIHNRSKPRITKSFAEKEEEELAEMKAKQFKALPLNHKVLDSCGELGVPRLPKKAATEVHAFSFATDSRVTRQRSRNSISSENSFTCFKARPAPKRPSSAHAAQQRPTTPTRLTMPKSPNLSTRSRASIRPSTAGEDRPTTPKSTFKARPMPKQDAWVPQKIEHKLTEPTPFNLRSDERGERIRAETERKLQEEAMRKATEGQFKARPVPTMPVAAANVQSHQSMKALTEPKPFNLRSAALSEQSKAKFQAHVDAEIQAEKQAAEFRARPIMQAEPMQIQRGTLPLTEVSAFELNTDRRQEERLPFEKARVERESQLAAARAEAEIARAEQESREVKAARKAMIPETRPMPVYGPGMEVRRSTKPLTEPMSPQFATNRRIR